MPHYHTPSSPVQSNTALNKPKPSIPSHSHSLSHSHILTPPPSMVPMNSTSQSQSRDLSPLLLTSPVYTRGLIRTSVWRKRFFVLSTPPLSPSSSDLNHNNNSNESRNIIKSNQYLNSTSHNLGTLNYFRLESDDEIGISSSTSSSSSQSSPSDFFPSLPREAQRRSDNNNDNYDDDDENIRKISILRARPWDASKDRRVPTFNELIKFETKENVSKKKNSDLNCNDSINSSHSHSQIETQLQILQRKYGMAFLDSLVQPFVFYGSTSDGYTRVYHCCVILDPTLTNTSLMNTSPRNQTQPQRPSTITHLLNNTPLHQLTLSPHTSATWLAQLNVSTSLQYPSFPNTNTSLNVTAAVYNYKLTRLSSTSSKVLNLVGGGVTVEYKVCVTPRIVLDSVLDSYAYNCIYDASSCGGSGGGGGIVIEESGNEYDDNGNNSNNSNNNNNNNSNNNNSNSNNNNNEVFDFVQSSNTTSPSSPSPKRGRRRSGLHGALNKLLLKRSSSSNSVNSYGYGERSNSSTTNANINVNGVDGSGSGSDFFSDVNNNNNLESEAPSTETTSQSPRQSSSNSSNSSYTILKRFSDFKVLLKTLSSEHSHSTRNPAQNPAQNGNGSSVPKVIKLCEKLLKSEHYVSHLNPGVIHKRVNDLNTLLLHLLTDADMCELDSLRVFLLPQHNTDTNASNDKDAATKGEFVDNDKKTYECNGHLMDYNNEDECKYFTSDNEEEEEQLEENENGSENWVVLPPPNNNNINFKQNVNPTTWSNLFNLPHPIAKVFLFVAVGVEIGIDVRSSFPETFVIESVTFVCVVLSSFMCGVVCCYFGRSYSYLYGRNLPRHTQDEVVILSPKIKFINKPTSTLIKKALQVPNPLTHVTHVINNVIKPTFTALTTTTTNDHNNINNNINTCSDGIQLDVHPTISKNFDASLPTTPSSTFSSSLPKKDPLNSSLKPYSSTPKAGYSTTNLNCWSEPPGSLFKVRGSNYLHDHVKVNSGGSMFECLGVELWLTPTSTPTSTSHSSTPSGATSSATSSVGVTQEPMSDIGRHPSMLNGNLGNSDCETFIINFMLPWGNLVSYFSIPPPSEMTGVNGGSSWNKFVNGTQEYRDAKLKLLPVVVEGPWIVRTAIGPGNSPAVVGKALPLKYVHNKQKKYFEIDLIVSHSSIARGILSVVRSHTRNITIDLAFIIEGCEEMELPERVLAAFRIHALDPEAADFLPKFREE